jgi:hypothetical protein
VAGLRQLGGVLGQGDPEIGQARIATIVEKHVGRLDVAMDHPSAVDGGERSGGGGQPFPRHRLWVRLTSR